MPTTVRGMTHMIWKHPANRGRRGRALAGMAAWQAWKRLVRKEFDLTVYDDMTLRAYPDSSTVGRLVYFGGLPDYEEMTFMRRYLRPGDGFIDAGANEGLFTLLAGRCVGPSGAVHAFEANPRYLQRLRRNVAANRLGWVSVHPNAVGAEPGTAEFVLRGVGSRIRTLHDQGETVRVRVVPLDDALPQRSWAMAKVDIEGAEQLALNGAEKLLGQAEPPVWMLELVDHFLERFGSSVHRVREWLGDHGYDLMLYDPDADRLVTAPNPLYPGPDALAVARTRRAEIDARLHDGRTT